jgi:four helix bundle protein
MPKIECFEDLEVWKVALESADFIYDLTSAGEFARDYALRDQIRRSGVSIFSNIAEGFERDGNREFANFLSIAKGSCGEARAQTIFAHRRKYISDEQFDLLSGKLIHTNKQISGFRNYLLRTEFKGRKFS